MVSKNIQRSIFVFLTVLIIIFRKYFLLFYAGIFYASFEYLNQNEKYSALKRHHSYNWLFIAFLAFIVVVRIRLFHDSETIEYHLNTLEHLFFAIIICLVINVYFLIFNIMQKNAVLKIMSVFVVFNLIGIVNEYFQNYFQPENQFYILKENNLKDIVINLLGSTFFLLASVNYKFKK